MSLQSVYEELSAKDQDLVKEAAEHEKLAAEHFAAGAICARGFMDELNKLAGVGGMGAEHVPPKMEPAVQPTIGKMPDIGKGISAAAAKAPKGPAMPVKKPAGAAAPGKSPLPDTSRMGMK